MSAPWFQGKQFAAISSSMNTVLDEDWAAAALSQEALIQGRTMYQNHIEGTSKTTMKLVGEALTKLGGVLVFDTGFWRGDEYVRQLYSWDHGVVQLVGEGGTDQDMTARVTTIDADFFLEMQRLFEASIGPKMSSGRVYVLAAESDGPKLKNLGRAGVPLERGHYNETVLEDYDAAVDDLSSLDPAGRLVVVNGPPGGGKTFMMKGLLDAVPNALFVLVPVGLVQELVGPTMISALMDIRRDKGDSPTVFIIEDADSCLVKREEGSTDTNAVSALLNLSDGIVGAMLDIRVVCSTNLQADDMDGAVVREGRLSRVIHVEKLTSARASALYKKLTGVDQEMKPMTLAEVFVEARHKGWKPAKKTKRSIGFGA